MPKKTEITQDSIKYRPDIDGLRAIAVAAVLLYHARLGVSGGFAGVDVFFVLSGFLITSIILKDAASTEGFSIIKFWERRVRRILPALLVVIVSTVAVGWFVLLPSDFMNLAKSVLAQAVFGGNFYFWFSGGYFGQPAMLKPLLHTWSLAVEEQYYLFFPALFIIGRKWRITTLRWVTGAVALLSLVWCVVLTRSAPDAAFYLLPSRAWELFSGAMLAMTPGNFKMPRFVCEAMGWCGLFAIGMAFQCYNRSTPFPGFAAVLPCAGTLAVLWANGSDQQSSTVARLLSARPLVFLGRISYSLYLWHWPILVYASYWQDDGIVRWPVRLGLLGLSVVLATVTWKFVETPFRTRRVLPNRRDIFTFGLSSPITCALVGVVLFLTHGMPSRFSEAVVICDAARSHALDPSIPRTEILNRTGPGDFSCDGRVGGPVHCLVWGDSHATSISTVLGKVAAEHATSIEFAIHYGTAPILDYESHDGESPSQDVGEWREAVVEHVRREHISNVLLAAKWLLYCGYPDSNITDGTRAREEMANKLAATTIALRGAGAKVWIMKMVPKQPKWVPLGMAKALMKGRSVDIGITKQEYMDFSRLENEIFTPAVANGATILDPAPYFFLNRQRCLVEISGHPLYFDDNHLNWRGAMMLADLFRPIWANDPLHSRDVSTTLGNTGFSR